MKKKVCFIVSSPLTAKAFLNGHFKALSSTFDVDLVANFVDSSRDGFYANNVFDVPVERKINFLSDFSALIKLYRVIVSNKYDVVHTVTPKAGLLGMLAAFMARVPLRHHTYTGQVWATRTGLSRYILKLLDKVVFSLSTSVLVDSKSQKSFLVQEGVISEGESDVLAAGSISGVDIKRFNKNNDSRVLIRNHYSVSDREVLFLFLGRVNRDKGIYDLVEAYRKIVCEYPEARLMIVGPDEDNTLEGIDFGVESIIRVGFTKRPEDFFNAADVFCLPSYREGFGSVIIEAAACGIPALASRIYGVTDAVEDEVTGILHSPGSVSDIGEGMRRFLKNESFRNNSASSSYQRARGLFGSKVVESAMLDFYKKVCGVK